MDGLYLILLGTAAFLAFGAVLMNSNRVPLLDFRTAYYSGECMLQHCDPYSEGDIQALYGQRTEHWPVEKRNRAIVNRNIYLPPAFTFTVPLALLPFDLAQALWFLLIVCSFILASFLIWNLAADHAPVLAAALLCFCLANSGSLIYFGNPAGFVVPLCAIAAWCFVREKFVLAGIACFVFSLCFKPHDGGLVWFFFFLAGGMYRKRALQTLAAVAVLSLPATLWVAQISPHWMREISTNMQSYSAQGGINDPSAGHGTEVLTNLQTITSFFWSAPHAYNLAAYLLCAPLLLVWGYITLRARPSPANAWLALAAISCFSMLPVYHRQYDAKLIILTIPAFALLWASGGATAWMALLVNGLGFLLNGDLPWVMFLSVVNKMHPAAAGPYSRALTALWDFPVPLSLLAMGMFYLWVYWQRAISAAHQQNTAKPQTISPA
jgi:hypothetical protein